MNTHACPLGPGPGSHILQALNVGWGVRIRQSSRNTTGEILLPQWWQVLLHGDGFADDFPWTDRWTRLQTAGAWAPNALILMTHASGGCIAVDLDRDENGNLAAWWHHNGHVRLLATTLKGLAQILMDGPKRLKKLRPDDPDSADPPDSWEGDLPVDPLTRQWQAAWPHPMDVLCLARAGQGVLLQDGWSRHPGQPLFAFRQQPSARR